jgi:hypothetical protein
MKINEVLGGLRKYEFNLALFESELGPINLNNISITKNQHVIHYLMRNYPGSDPFAIFNNAIERKIHQIDGSATIMESATLTDALNDYFDKFNQFNTGIKVKPGDKLVVLELDAFILLGKSNVTLEGSMVPRTVYSVSAHNVQFTDGSSYPTRTAKMPMRWQQVIFFKDTEAARQCVTLFRLLEQQSGVVRLSVGVDDTLEEHIVKVKGGYELRSKKGNKNLGKYPTRAGAEKRERQVQYFKHAK